MSNLKTYYRICKTYLQKLVGKSVEALFCRKCNKFKIVSMIKEENSIICSECSVEMVHCAISIDGIYE